MSSLEEIRNIFLDKENKIVSLDRIEEKIEELQVLFMGYECGIREVKTKLENLDNEFKVKSQRNPIEYMKSRVKSPESIIKKLLRKGAELNPEAIKENLNDIAGIRVICSFIDDIYYIANILKNQTDITLIHEKDYIKYPKENGYRSLHMVLEIPVFFSDHIEPVRVEVQIRTIAMDFWASLEHKLYYKTYGVAGKEIAEELKQCADVISSTDQKMQKIQRQVEKL